MSGKNEKLFTILDLLMSEYGGGKGSLEYYMALPGDVVAGLVHAIQHRRQIRARDWTKLIGAACAAGFAGKLDKLDGLFKESTQGDDTGVDEAAWKGQVKSMWMRMRTKNKKNLTTEDYKVLEEKFEEEWTSGNVEM